MGRAKGKKPGKTCRLLSRHDAIDVYKTTTGSAFFTDISVCGHVALDYTPLFTQNNTFSTKYKCAHNFPQIPMKRTRIRGCSLDDMTISKITRVTGFVSVFAAG